MGRNLAAALAKATLIFALLSCSVALAQELPAKDQRTNDRPTNDRSTKDLQWQDAKLIDITTEPGGAVVVPIAALAGGPITKTFYWMQTNDTIYVLGPVLTRSQLLNVTLHGPTKLAIDGNNAHILDDYGKNQKLRIIEKIARPEPDNPQ